MKRTVFIAGSVWTALVVLSFFWNYIDAKKEQQAVALEAARSFFDQIVVTRRWNAGHGGVYVPVTNSTQPNIFLKGLLRDIKVSNELTLTKVNPAFMTRQIAEIAAQQEGIQFHITSLRPVRPKNKPTEREAKALRAFDLGLTEVGEFVQEADGSYFFYMGPLVTEEKCLKCHAEHGYEVGDIRGGISVTLPFIKTPPIMVLLIAHFAIGLVGLLGIIISGNKLKEAYEIITRQAAIDALTEIPNRRSFSEQLLREFNRFRREQYPLSIIMCDVDNFKLYNDNYGHNKGDECLKEVAQVIEKTVRRPGDFCARYGGEEFVVILPNTPQEGALQLAEEIRGNVKELEIEHLESSPAHVVTISLGVATIEAGATISHEDLVSRADSALYQAKEKGRNRVEVYHET